MQRSDTPPVGVCPANPAGHEWARWFKELPETHGKPCVHCGKSGREFFAEATRTRQLFFSHIRTPESAKGVKPKEA